MFGLFKKNNFFSVQQKENIVAAIGSMERATSGEIRVYVESKNPYMDPVDRAKEIFFKLKMQQTEHRNAVLLYIATKHRQLALYGDEGIYNATGQEYWNSAVKEMIAGFSTEDISAGICRCIYQVGETLKEKFPYSPTDDKNELPDDIVFGK